MPDNIRKPKATSGPLLIWIAGSSVAAPRLEQMLTVGRESAQADGLRFQLASMRPDKPRQLVGRRCVPAA
jgi:hypothetical protein